MKILQLLELNKEENLLILANATKNRHAKKCRVAFYDAENKLLKRCILKCTSTRETITLYLGKVEIPDASYMILNLYDTHKDCILKFAVVNF